MKHYRIRNGSPLEFAICMVGVAAVEAAAIITVFWDYIIGG